MSWESRQKAFFKKQERDLTRREKEIEQKKRALQEGANPSEPWPSDRALSELSLIFGGIGAIGVGAPVVTGSKLIMWGFIAVGSSGIALVIAARIYRYVSTYKHQSLKSLLFGKWKWTACGAVLVLAAVFAASWLQTIPLPLTFKDVFDKDFELPKSEPGQTIGAMRLAPTGSLDFEVEGKKYPTWAKTLFDVSTAGYSQAYFIPRSAVSYAICVKIAEHPNFAFDMFPSKNWVIRTPGDSTPMKLTDFSFSKRLYIYHEDDFTLKQQADLDALYKQKNIFLTLRGPEYFYARHWMIEKQQK